MTNYQPVSIEIELICQQLSQDAGREVSDVEAALWLRAEGFVLFGETWMADDQSMRKLEDLQQRLAAQPRQ